jgi:hypothetical protein
LIASQDFFMISHAQLLAEFRSQVTRLLQDRDTEWDRSRRLIEAARFTNTIHRLVERAQHTDLPSPVRDALVTALNEGRISRIQDLPGARLKELTGLPPSKALRALCVWFDLVEGAPSHWPVSSFNSESVATFLREHSNPFDLLVTADVPSVVEFGAGDLSFASELVELYAPRIREHNRTLLLHCIDRLSPQSKLGGPLHPSQDRLQTLRSSADVSFQFLGDQDMCGFEALAEAGRLAPRYAVAVCWAPATPTFAYEPARLSPEVIQGELVRTKGPYRHTQYAGEGALEVKNGDRTLLFPPWKFEIRGPLALLDLLARSGCLGVLGAVDNQVFWEVLAQLLEDDRYRPEDEPFTSENVPRIFSPVYGPLATLPIGESLDLASCGTLRRGIPRMLPSKRLPKTYRFHSVSIRRGACFPGIPASHTARRFSDMVEEAPPWMMTLVPAV